MRSRSSRSYSSGGISREITSVSSPRCSHRCRSWQRALRGGCRAGFGGRRRRSSRRLARFANRRPCSCLSRPPRRCQLRSTPSANRRLPEWVRPTNLGLSKRSRTSPAGPRDPSTWRSGSSTAYISGPARSSLSSGAARGKRDGFVVDVLSPIQFDGAIVSSTRIRNLLLAGDVEAAARLLGRPYSIRGRVVHGDKRGRALGFPTINLALPKERLLPRDGIYAMWAEMGEGRFKAAASLGVRPTFGGGERVLEAYLLDYSGELYGEEVEVAFVKRLRDEIAFASPSELSAQIARDVEETRRVLI